jgi:hypothetical protein
MRYTYLVAAVSRHGCRTASSPVSTTTGKVDLPPPAVGRIAWSEVDPGAGTGRAAIWWPTPRQAGIDHYRVYDASDAGPDSIGKCLAEVEHDPLRYLHGTAGPWMGSAVRVAAVDAERREGEPSPVRRIGTDAG